MRGSYRHAQKVIYVSVNGAGNEADEFTESTRVTDVILAKRQLSSGFTVRREGA